MNYDVVGDVHGHAALLEVLLAKLGYQNRSGAWRHSDREVIFVGDLIDRGPGQRQTLKIARDMVDAGSARVVMGNHEFNAIGWATPDPATLGHHLRQRGGDSGEKSRQQHSAFLAEIAEDGQEHKEWVAWFLELPLWIEETELRVIHACWSPKHVATLLPYLRDGARLTPDVVELASRKGSDPYKAIEILLKGMEVKLPCGITFKDAGGHCRSEIRTRWWNPDLDTFRSAYIGPAGAIIPDLPLPDGEKIPEPDRPTFIGHYWFDPKSLPEPVARRVACVDYSVANKGPLVAYRFDGEHELTADKFMAVYP